MPRAGWLSPLARCGLLPNCQWRRIVVARGSPCQLAGAPLCNPDAELEVFSVRPSSRREAGRDAQPGDDLASPKNRLGARMPQPPVAPGSFHVQQEQMGNLQLSVPRSEEHTSEL